MTDTEYASERAHAVAMAAWSTMTGVQHLIHLARDSNDRYLVQRDLYDLELTYAALGKLVENLKGDANACR